MRIIISPAKKMKVDTDSFPPEGFPLFLEQAEHLAAVLRSMTPRALQNLWRCGDTIAQQNVERLEKMDLRRNLTPALLSYQGIQYQYMAPGVFDREQFSYVREHLRILSGLYGLLRPFDGVAPYRLEMGARLSVDGGRDLYDFWGDRLARTLAEETDVVINLASQEYGRGVAPHLPPCVQLVTCVFGELQNGKVVEKGTLCKMARGEMVRWLASQGTTRPEDLPAFQGLGYKFSPAYSTPDRLVFLKKAEL